MKILRILTFCFLPIIIQACSGTRSGNINKPDDCKVPGLDWMEGTEGYNNKEVFDLATIFEAAARSDAKLVSFC